MPGESKTGFSRRQRGRSRRSGAFRAPDDLRVQGAQPRLAGPGWLAPGRRSRLPAEPKPIIGREQELRLACELLSRDEVRLLTLTGPPGVGKTRLAIEVANATVNQYQDGACFADLSPIADWRQVIEVIAHALGLREFDRRIAVEVVEEYLRDRELLLLVDNFEHVLEAADIIARILLACPNLKVVATSRAPLHLRWERELGVTPLLVPRDSTDQTTAPTVAAAAAGRLFVERAQAVAPEFVLNDADAPAVAEICQRLDGLPLALELAAARIKLFPPRALLRRIARAEQPDPSSSTSWLLLSGQQRDLPPRHQTLLRAINWSYDLLSAEEQAVFRRLAVFLGGCSLDAAESVATNGLSAGLDLLAGLVDKSLLGRDEQPDGEPRLRLLETIRVFALQQLELHHETDAARACHAHYYLDLVEQAVPELVGPHQQMWFSRFERERANLLAVERWAVAQADAMATVRLGGALWPFWLARDDASHSRERVQAILRLVGTVPGSSALVHALHGAGLLAEKLGEYATCRSLLQMGVSMARELEDPAALATVLDSLGRQKFIEGRYADARALLDESHALLQAANNPIGLARVLSHLGFLEFLEGRTDEARAIFHRGLAIAEAAEDKHRVAEFMDNFGNMFAAESDFDQASDAFESAIRIWRNLGQGHWLAMALNNLGRVEVQRGERDLARAHLLEALTLAHRMGNRRRMAYTLSAVGELLVLDGDRDRAATLRAVASAAIAEIGATRPSGADTATSSQANAPAATGITMSLDRAVEETIKHLGVLLESGQQEEAQRGATPTSAASARARGTGAQVGGLTRREHEVAVLVMSGYTNRQIAEQLVVTEGTAENYVQRILGKLGFNNRAQIAVWAIQHGVGPPPNF